VVRVDVGSVAVVSEVYVASIFRVKLCRLGEVSCMYSIFYSINRVKVGRLHPG
jgi:prolipoprotein diacylglyceryltransferase